MSVTLTDALISQNEGDTSVITRTATFGGHAAEAQVESADVAAHGGYVGARACGALSDQLLASGDWAGAAAAARAGLEALGRGYAPVGTKDDTKLKIAAAEDRIRQGHAEDGARVLARTLGSRIAMYEARYGVKGR